MLLVDILSFITLYDRTLSKLKLISIASRYFYAFSCTANHTENDVTYINKQKYHDNKSIKLVKYALS